MNYGMRCHDLCPKTDIDTLVNTIAANHVDQIQLAMGKSIAGYNFDHGHYSPGFARMIRKKLDENDIHVAVLGCYINPVNPDEKERQKAVAKFIEHLKYAKEIVSAAEKLGVIVGVEAVHDHTLYCPEIMRRFLEDIDSPNVEAILDPVNLISAEHVADQDEEINKAFRLYGDRISVVHVKDFVMKEGKPEFAHVGEGLFHYEPLMKNLKKDKPYITMLLENSTKERYHQDVEYLQKIYDAV